MTGTIDREFVDPEYIARRAARVLVIDGSGRLLMLRGFDPARPENRFWVTVGGGLEPGETLPEAAAREVFEETGLRVAPSTFAEPVWRDVAEFTFDGRWYRQEQDFFVLRVESFAVSRSNWDDVEQVALDRYDWWTIDDFATAGDPYYPPELPELYRAALEAD